ncbi:SCO2583 family membrane protein [Streptomyces niveus]
MAGRGDPPEGTPEGTPGGGEDEYRSVVFDESFVRAARLQEFSAKERMGDHSHAVRRRDPAEKSGAGSLTPRRGSVQALLLVLVVAVAFGTAVYVGVRPPYRPAFTRSAEPLRMTVIPLAPTGAVPGDTPESLLRRSPAARFDAGASGIPLPLARRTPHFTENDVMTALTTAKDYLVASSVDPDVLTGAERRSVRVMLDPEQLPQFDQTFADPSDDGRHAPAGWLVRFDPAKVALAESSVRVRGTLRFAESAADTIDVFSDHTFVYALRPAGQAAKQDASLFTVRRTMHFRFDREDLPRRRAELLTSQVQAGPQTCSTEAPGTLRPLLAGGRATPTGPDGTDPYATGPPTAGLCGVLDTRAQPRDR